MPKTLNRIGKLLKLNNEGVEIIDFHYLYEVLEDFEERIEALENR